MNVRAGSTCSGLTALQSDAFLVMLGHDASLAKEGKKTKRTNINILLLRSCFQNSCMTQCIVFPRNNYGIILSINRLKVSELFLTMLSALKE